jgi:hypothetical protein
MALPNWFPQLKKKISGGIRLRVEHPQIACGDGNSADGLLFPRVRFLDQNRSPKIDRLLSLPADQQEGAGQHECANRYPSLDFVNTSHARIITNVFYMMTVEIELFRPARQWRIL